MFGRYVRNVISSSHQPFSILMLHHGKAQNACFFFGEYRYGFIDFENAMLTLTSRCNATAWLWPSRWLARRMIGIDAPSIADAVILINGS
jgi:hypothetical protein